MKRPDALRRLSDTALALALEAAPVPESALLKSVFVADGLYAEVATTTAVAEESDRNSSSLRRLRSGTFLLLLTLAEVEEESLAPIDLRQTSLSVSLSASLSAVRSIRSSPSPIELLLAIFRALFPAPPPDLVQVLLLLALLLLPSLLAVLFSLPLPGFARASSDNVEAAAEEEE